MVHAWIWQMLNSVLTHLVSNAPFLYSLKTSENCKVFWCFQGVQKEYIGNKWVNLMAYELFLQKTSQFVNFCV